MRLLFPQTAANVSRGELNELSAQMTSKEALGSFLDSLLKMKLFVDN